MKVELAARLPVSRRFVCSAMAYMTVSSVMLRSCHTTAQGPVKSSETGGIPCKGMVAWPGGPKSKHAQPLKLESTLNVIRCQHRQSTTQGMTCNHIWVA